MKRKQSIIGILLSILMIINIFPIIKASAASFTPRYSLSYEDTQSKYWASGTYGVSNGFPRNWNSGYSGGNCTWYAFGRAWELLGSLPNLCTNNAGAWYSYNKSHGYYPYGSTPKLGAIACWDHYDNDTGHVAVVEEIGSDYIVCSESGWSYTNGYFSTKTRSLNDGTLGMGSSYRFLGYIYIGDFTPDIRIPDPVTDLHGEKDVYHTGYCVGFYWTPSARTTYQWVYLWKDGQEISSANVGMDSSYLFTPSEPGVYTLVIRPANSLGFNESSKSASVTVVERGKPLVAPSNPKLSFNKKKVAIHDTITFNFSVDNADHMYLPINVNGVREHFIEVSGNTYTANFTKPGTYEICLYATNALGNCGTGYMYFEVYGYTSPQNVTLTADKYKVKENETLYLSTNADYAEAYVINVYRDDVLVKEYKYLYDDDKTNYPITFSESGTYKIISHARNYYNSTDSAPIYIIVEPVSTNTPTTSTTATRSSGQIEVQTKISNLSQNASCIATVYSTDGALLGQTANDVNSSTNSVSAYFPNYSNASYVKVFLWDNLQGMKPLTNFEKVTL